MTEQRPTGEIDDSTVAGARPKRVETLWTALRKLARRWGFLCFLLVIAFVFRGVLLPFVFAILLVYLLAPIVNRLQPKIGRVLAIILCYLVILGFLAGFFGLFLPAVVRDMARLRESVPATIAEINDVYLPRASEWVEHTFGAVLPKPEEVPAANSNHLVMQQRPDGSWSVDLDRVRLTARAGTDGSWTIGPPSAEPNNGTDLGNELRELLAERTEEMTGFIGPAIQALVKGVVGFLTSFVITFMLAGFVLVDIDRVTNFIRSLVPHESRGGFDELWKRMDRGLGGVVRGQLLICLVNGALTFVGLIIFDIKYSILLGVMAGVFSLIPIFGTILSSAPILIIALISNESGPSIGPALGMLAWIVGIHLLEANVLNPKIIGDSAEIHPVIVVFALIAGEHVFGLVGALLAIPVTSIVQTMFLQARRHSPVFSRDPE
ncbi:MAG: AI-2E family transporter [Deltaproteobacteria bacterium]|nr:AI-2E family transporter [Nannocystaceae bacterium]